MFKQKFSYFVAHYMCTVYLIISEINGINEPLRTKISMLIEHKKLLVL